MTERSASQLRLDMPDVAPPFPSTRYQGSKLKLVNWIWDHIKDLPFDTALDAFGGTGCVSHMLKGKGVQVTYNDLLRFNYLLAQTRSVCANGAADCVRLLACGSLTLASG